jgi:hypothetical protein
MLKKIEGDCDMKFLEALSEVQKGFIFMLGGLLIVLYAFDLLGASFDTIIIVGGFSMILYGFIKVGGLQKLRGIIASDKEGMQKPPH